MLNWLLDRPAIANEKLGEKRFAAPNAFRQLLRFNPESGRSFSCLTKPEEDGTVTASAYIILDGVVHRSDATGATVRSAAENAAATMWIDLGFTEDSPIASNEAPKPDDLAIQTLNTSVQQKKLQSVTYSFESATYGKGHLCTLTCVDGDGAEHVLTGYGGNKRAAQRMAATGVVQLLSAQQKSLSHIVDAPADKIATNRQTE